MPQIKQVCSVTKGSQSVVIAGVNLTQRILKNFVFMVDGSFVPYTVAANSIFVGGNTQLTLTGAYLGDTSASAPGIFVSDYTYPDLIPTLSQGDVGTAVVFTAAMNRIQEVINSTKASIAQVTFKPPVIVKLMIGGQLSGDFEMGQSVAQAELSWILSGSAPNAQTLNGVGVIPPGTLSKLIAGPFTASKAWTLTLTSTDPDSASLSTSATVSLRFTQKRHWGVSASTTLGSAQILTLDASEFALTRDKSVTYDATGGRYPYYAYPATLGAISGVTVGGLAFSDFVESIVSHTNAFGFTENYRVVRFNGIQNGAKISVIWS